MGAIFTLGILIGALVGVLIGKKLTDIKWSSNADEVKRIYYNRRLYKVSYDS